MGHERGFTNEDDACYIDFQYSGYIIALVYVFKAIYQIDRNQYKLLYAQTDWLVNRDIDRASTQINITIYFPRKLACSSV